MWQPVTERLSLGLTFDDVFLVPSPSNHLPEQVNTSTELCRGIELEVPFVSSPMDRVTEEKMAIAMALLGGVGIIHRGLGGDRLLSALAAVKRYMAGVIHNPITVTPDMTLQQVKEMKAPYTGFPVIFPEKKLGDFTKPELLGLITRRDMDGKEPNTTVGELMTPFEKLLTAPSKISPSEALRLMRARKVEKLPIVENDKELWGLITRRDLDLQSKYPQATVDQTGRLRAGVAVNGALSKRQEMLGLVKNLVQLGVDFVCVDSAHGGHIQIVNAVRELKQNFPGLNVIAGNVADGRSAEDLIMAGVSALRCGFGPGSICTTRIVTGTGVPQITAISDCRQASRNLADKVGFEAPVIADGGIKVPGDVVKALAAGASSVMFGQVLAGTDESPGEKVVRDGRQIKSYRGMGSAEAMREHGGDRYFKDGDATKSTPEGVSGYVPYTGTVADQFSKFLGGLKGGMGYNGALTIPELWTRQFIRVTQAGLHEAYPHSIIVIEGDATKSRN